MVVDELEKLDELEIVEKQKIYQIIYIILICNKNENRTIF